MKLASLSRPALALFLFAAPGALVPRGAGAGPAAATDVVHPEKALCVTCTARGGAHGDEKVAARREYEGRWYYFCSEECAGAFDEFPQGYSIKPMPRPAPPIVLARLDGPPLDLAELRGRVVLLDFWATWCAPCLQAMPEIEKLHRDLAERGLTVVGVSIDEPSKEKDVRAALAKRGVSYETALDGGDAPAWYALGVPAVPAAILLDGGGNVVTEWKGRVPADEVRLAVEYELARLPSAD